MHTIENNQLSVTINAAGAELNSIFHKINGREYLWNGDARFWAKRSPVLFPIIGTLKENTYFFNDKKYELGRHGFARDKNFVVANESESSISFSLADDEETLKVFPFHFLFSISYTLTGNKLSVGYYIKNTGSEEMFFSVGGHPAFKLPLTEGVGYDDYYLLFNKTEQAGRWPISKDGLIEAAPEPLINNTNKLPLSKELFYKDALVFKHLQSDEVELRSRKDAAGFTFSFPGFPYLGIWAAKDAGFVCIEPWCGIADSVTASQHLPEKEGIISLMPAAMFERTWSVAIDD